MTGWLFGCSAAKKLLEKYCRGKSWKQAPRKKTSVTSKISGGKTLLVLVTPEGKEGHKDMLHPLAGLQHSNHSGDGGTFLGREREGGMGRLTCSQQWGKGKSITDIVLSILQSLLGGKGHVLPRVVSAARWEEKTQGKGFLGHLHCSSGTADGEEEWEQERSVES